MYAAAYIWAKVINHLEQQLSEVTVSAWFDDAELIELNEHELIIYSPSDFRQEVIRERFSKYVQDTLKEQFHLDAKLVVWGDRERHDFLEKQSAAEPYLLNPQFSFDTYVTGDSNQMAVKIARAAAKDPGNEFYNPLFFYGPPGVGKTHLLYAIANHIHQNMPDKKVVYIRGDQFTNELVQAIQHGKTAEFKQKYRHEPDAFLIDDIHFIAGKESTQEEFFHTFNALYERNKLVVMTADRKPSDMATLQERLRGRFGEGIMVAITPPDRDLRVSILQEKSKKLRLELDEEVIQYLADHLTSNVRQIEGALKKIRAFRELASMELTVQNVARIVEDLCSSSPAMPVTADLIIRHVCRYYGIEEDALKGQQKSRGVAEPRQIAMYLTRKLLHLSFPAIGKVFGGRDHGTVHHAVKKVDTLLSQKDNPISGILADILSNIENSTG